MTEKETETEDSDEDEQTVAWMPVSYLLVLFPPLPILVEFNSEEMKQ